MSSDDGFHEFDQDAQDVVLAVNYNLYGNRIVTASADHHLRVYDRNDATQEWSLTESWRGHDAEITDVSSVIACMRTLFLSVCAFSKPMNCIPIFYS